MRYPRAFSAVGVVAGTVAGLLLVASPAIASPPAIGSTSATDIQGVSALLTGSVNPEGFETTYHFEYGTGPCSTGSCIQTPGVDLGSGLGDRYAAAAVSGLSPDTTYRYRLVAGSTGGIAAGPEAAFTTTQGFGFLPGTNGFDITASEEDGSVDSRAGSHPYALTTAFGFNLGGEFSGQPATTFTDGDLRNLSIALPPGLIENPNAVSQCTQVQFHTPRQSPFEASQSGESCPDASQIGVIAIHSSFGEDSTRYFGVFNLAPPPGIPSQLGFSPFGAPITFTPHIRQADGEYGLTLDLHSLPQRFDLYGFELTTWGTPWNVAHNAQRGNCLNEVEPSFPFAKAKCSVGRPRTHPWEAYLTLPTSCTGPLTYTASADSWQQPSIVGDTASSHDDQGLLDLEGCEQLEFAPHLSVQPSIAEASSASGLDFNLDLNDEGVTNPSALAPSPVKKAVVALPEGFTINPSLAAGLGVCTPAQYAAATGELGSGCPSESKIGTLEVHTPLFAHSLGGSLYLAKPFENPFDSLIALYLVFRDPERGIVDKLAGQVEADPKTGQLTTTFDDLPQLPYSHLNVHLREGQRSVLITPSACGAYGAPLELSPWRDPKTVLRQTPQVQITKGIGGAPCPTGAAPPFEPKAKAGMLNSNAGSYTPFYLHLTRDDTEQEITSYSAKLPKGLLGKIAGIPYCPEVAIAAAKWETGAEESEHPSCPAASEIGHTQTGYGVGGVLAYAPGRLYLAGPYHGSSFSVVAIDSATVGPFDLGVIVVRSAIRVDPRTAQVSIDSAGSDPIPHIIDGIPLHLRDIRVYISRPTFTLNPTSCDPSSVISTLTGSSAPFTNPVDIAATPTVPFQAFNCSSLKFEPKLSLRLKGGTKRGDYPALTAVVTPRRGDANIAKAAVTLPPTEFLAQNHIRTICTRPQLEAEACPRGSIYGHATALTPLLAEPMRGPVYLRSSSNPLPDLVAVLHGAGVRIVLEGRIDSSHGGIRGSFDVIPDAPVTKFTMIIDGGKRGVLVNERNICSAPQFATARFIAQDNTGEALRPRVRADCPKQSSHRTRKGGAS